MSIFDQQFDQTISLGDTKLPPTWVKQPASTNSIAPIIDSICISGKERTLATNIINLLEQTSDMAVLCSFLLADAHISNAILKAAKRGVRVYLMMASEAKLGQEPREEEFDQTVLKEHKALLKQLGGKVHIRSAEYFHAKMILTDPFSDDAKGFMMTANMTKEAIERNEELGIVLNRNEIVEMRQYVHWAIWEAAQHEMLDNKTFSSVKPLKQFALPDSNHHVFATTPTNSTKHSALSTALKTKVLAVIQGAKQQLIVASFGWQEDHEVVQAIIAKAKAGVHVTILARFKRAKITPCLEKLAQAGAIVYGYRWLHAKAVWTDNHEAIIMSANIEKHGLDTGFELGVYLQDSRVAALHQYLTHWMTQTNWQLKSNTRLADHLGEVMMWRNNNLETLAIGKSLQQPIEDINAKSLDKMAQKANLPKPSWQETPYHQIQFGWTVKAPLLANNSKEQLKTVKPKSEQKTKQKSKQQSESNKPIEKPQQIAYVPPVYKEPNGRKVIAIEHPNQLTKAIELSKQLSIATIVAKPIATKTSKQVGK